MADIQREKLEPCPFCGWTQPQLVRAVVDDEARELVESPFVQCLECGTIGPPHEDGDDAQAVKLWNTRDQPPESERRALAVQIVFETAAWFRSQNGGDVQSLVDRVVTLLHSSRPSDQSEDVREAHRLLDQEIANVREYVLGTGYYGKLGVAISASSPLALAILASAQSATKREVNREMFHGD